MLLVDDDPQHSLTISLGIRNADDDLAAGAAAATRVWSYIGELVFNMLILLGSVKMADRVVREMMGCKGNIWSNELGLQTRELFAII